MLLTHGIVVALFEYGVKYDFVNPMSFRPNLTDMVTQSFSSILMRVYALFFFPLFSFKNFSSVICNTSLFFEAFCHIFGLQSQHVWILS